MRRCTPCRSANARIDNPSRRWSRRIASNSSTFDLTEPALPHAVDNATTFAGWGQIKPAFPPHGVSQVGPDQAGTVGPNQSVKATLKVAQKAIVGDWTKA